ncbi:MAG: hypothetical protein CW338_08630, partial [Clostridiales bacterium]|nr:hypothetical protein [Clostridiales bacterium]
MKKAASIILCLLFVFVFSAGGLSESTPRIWRVTDGRGNCIYLLGTVHVSVPDMFPVAGIEAVLDECDTLALEIYDDRSSADRDEEDRSLLEILWDLVCDLLEEVDPDGCGLEGEELRQASELVGIPSWILRFLSPELVNGLIQVTLMEQ